MFLVRVRFTVAGIIMFQSTSSNDSYGEAIVTGVASTWYHLCVLTTCSVNCIVEPVVDVTTHLVRGL
jgi:hypothetical protein